MIDNVNEVAPYLKEKLEELVAKFDFLNGERGLGLMRGLVFDTDKVKPADVVRSALSHGLVLITAGTDVVRFLPPLVITKADIDEMIEKLTLSLTEQI